MKDRLIGEISCHNLQGAFQIFDKRIQDNSSRLIQVNGNIIQSRRSFQEAGIRRQIPGNHSHIPVTVSRPAQVFADGNAYLPHLLLLRGRLHDPYLSLSFIGPAGITEKLLLQMRHGRILPEPGHRISRQNHILSPGYICLRRKAA